MNYFKLGRGFFFIVREIFVKRQEISVNQERNISKSGKFLNWEGIVCKSGGKDL